MSISSLLTASLAADEDELDRGQNVLRFDRASLRDGLTGLALGVGAQTLVALLGAAAGAYLFRWNWDISHLGPWLLYFGTMFLVAFQEEAMLRGSMRQLTMSQPRPKKKQRSKKPTEPSSEAR